MKKPPIRPDESTLLAYLLGDLSPAAAAEVERFAAENPDFQAQLDQQRAQMAHKVQRNEVKPRAGAKAALFARAEVQDDAVGVDFPPFIHSKVLLRDFEPWLTPALAALEAEGGDFACVPMGASSDTVTCLARMGSSIPTETHTTEIERVMVVRGYCNFIVGEKVMAFGPGDRYTLPLHVPHSAHVTTGEPCIFIVQRSLV